MCVFNIYIYHIQYHTFTYTKKKKKWGRIDEEEKEEKELILKYKISRVLIMKVCNVCCPKLDFKTLGGIYDKTVFIYVMFCFVVWFKDVLLWLIKESVVL